MIKLRLHHLVFYTLIFSFIGLFGLSFISRAEIATLTGEMYTNDSVEGEDTLEINWIATVKGAEKWDLVYSIDCDGDGVFEEVSPTTQKDSYEFKTCEYEDPGDYIPRVVITRDIEYIEKTKIVKVKKSIFIASLSA